MQGLMSRSTLQNRIIGLIYMARIRHPAADSISMAALSMSYVLSLPNILYFINV